MLAKRGKSVLLVAAYYETDATFCPTAYLATSDALIIGFHVLFIINILSTCWSLILRHAQLYAIVVSRLTYRNVLGTLFPPCVE